MTHELANCSQDQKVQKTVAKGAMTDLDSESLPSMFVPLCLAQNQQHVFKFA